MRWRWGSYQTRAERPVPVVHFPFTAVFALLFFSISPKKKKGLHMDLIPGLNEFDNQSENECSPEPKKEGLERTTLNQNWPYQWLYYHFGHWLGFGNPLMERLCPWGRINPAYVTMRHSVLCSQMPFCVFRWHFGSNFIKYTKTFVVYIYSITVFSRFIRNDNLLYMGCVTKRRPE